MKFLTVLLFALLSAQLSFAKTDQIEVCGDLTRTAVTSSSNARVAISTLNCNFDKLYFILNKLSKEQKAMLRANPAAYRYTTQVCLEGSFQDLGNQKYLQVGPSVTFTDVQVKADGLTNYALKINGQPITCPPMDIEFDWGALFRGP